MLVDVAERAGPSLAYWLEAPFALALWTHYQLRELDAIRQWEARAARLEAAELMHLAFNEPRRLDDERTKLLAAAAGHRSIAEARSLMERGERMARFIRKGQVLVS